MKNGNGRIKRLIAGGLVGLVGLTFAPSVADAAISTTNFCANVPTGQSGFTDIAQTGVHQRNVECAKDAGLVQGQTATTFGTGPLSRGQMATIIANVIDFADAQDAPGGATVPSLPTAAASQDRFTDDETSVHENNINRLAQAGVVNGTSATTFSPSANVSRGQMASFIAQALAFIQGAALPEGQDQFTDDETSVHEANLNRLGTADIIDGTGPSSGRKATANPSGEVSRPQTASFSVQALAFLHANGVINPVPQRAGTGALSRPELISATIVGTVTEGVNQGTTINFRFDEAGTVPGGNGSAPFFKAFNNAGLVDTGDVVSSSADFLSVNVRFNTINTTALAAGLTLATVEGPNEGAAFVDFNGEFNPEGDAPLNNVGSQALPAGVTNAPDITSFGNFRAANATQTFVDVTYDEAANPGAGTPAVPGAQLLLIYQQGLVEVPCAFDSGTGTTVLTYICNNNADDGDATTTIAAAAPIIARAAQEPGTVLDTTATAHPNPLQVAEAANSGNTGGPDIVSAQFNLDATNGGNPVDSALVTFDQNVNVGGAPTLWTAFGVNGQNEIANPTSVAPAGAGSPNQVVLFFADQALVGKVGLNIDDGAVTNSDGANAGFPNREDEVGVGSATASNTAGNTTRPEMTGATKSPTLNLGGQPTGGTTTSYAFDEDVDIQTLGDFHAYNAAGLLFIATACTNDTAEATDNVVRCTAYVNTATAAAASNTELASLVLATVQDGAVGEETGGLPSIAEGAAVVSG